MTTTPHAIHHILRLRRLERSSDPDVRRELRAVRRFLESTVGATISRAEAARLLGVSQTALDRWIDKGEIAAVLTPEDRREIPLSELLDLLEEIEQARAEGVPRPLTRIIRERQRHSAEVIDLDRLLPRRRSRSHVLPEIQALAYHRLVGERLNEQLVDEARDRLDRWRETGRIHPHWAEQWDKILALPLPRIATAIGADTKAARELRQTSPFAGALTEQERRRLSRAVEERVLG